MSTVQLPIILTYLQTHYRSLTPSTPKTIWSPLTGTNSQNKTQWPRGQPSMSSRSTPSTARLPSAQPSSIRSTLSATSPRRDPNSRNPTSTTSCQASSTISATHISFSPNSKPLWFSFCSRTQDQNSRRLLASSFKRPKASKNYSRNWSLVTPILKIINSYRR